MPATQLNSLKTGMPIKLLAIELLDLQSQNVIRRNGEIGIFAGFKNEKGGILPQVHFFNEKTNTFTKPTLLYNAAADFEKMTNIGFADTATLFTDLSTTNEGGSLLSKFTGENDPETQFKTQLQSVYWGGHAMSSGSDPEIFVVDENDVVIPAFLFLPEKSKAIKFPQNNIGQGCAFWDGFQAEYTVAPKGCLEYHTDNLRQGIIAIVNAAKAYNPKARLTHRNVVQIPSDVLMTAPENTVLFGCAPSKNVYGAAGEQIENPRELPIRFSGGHLHFSIKPEFRNLIPEMIRLLDIILGTLTVGMFANVDAPARRRFYGLAGEYREPGHGLEYRVLSNAWLIHPALTNAVYEVARQCIVLGHGGWRAKLFPKVEDKWIQDVINNYDVAEARKFVDKHKAIYQSIMKWKIGTAKAGNVLLQLAMEDIESCGINPKTIEANWSVGGVWHSLNSNEGTSFRSFSEITKLNKSS